MHSQYDFHANKELKETILLLPLFNNNGGLLRTIATTSGTSLNKEHYFMLKLRLGNHASPENLAQWSTLFLVENKSLVILMQSIDYIADRIEASSSFTKISLKSISPRDIAINRLGFVR
jgi:uncharacterized protein (UPF0212 family)